MSFRPRKWLVSIECSKCSMSKCCSNTVRTGWPWLRCFSRRFSCWASTATTLFGLKSSRNRLHALLISWSARACSTYTNGMWWAMAARSQKLRDENSMPRAIFIYLTWVEYYLLGSLWESSKTVCEHLSDCLNSICSEGNRSFLSNLAQWSIAIIGVYDRRFPYRDNRYSCHTQPLPDSGTVDETQVYKKTTASAGDAHSISMAYLKNRCTCQLLATI